MEQELVQRPRSLRSVASNSTIASGTSLSRRPRTRRRSKTVTGAPTPPSEPPLTSLPVQSDLPYLSDTTAQEPTDGLSPAWNGSFELPPRPPKSPHRQLTAEPLTCSVDSSSSQGGRAADETVVSELPPPAAITSVEPANPTKALSLPHLDVGLWPLPSAFSRDPSLTPVNNVRDSVSTQKSGTSSSLYPPSTLTFSRVDSPNTPLSVSHDVESIHQSASMNPEVKEAREYDNDDVAYRLRLLVKNKYFLPPAHAKPSPADFAPPPDSSKKHTKSPSPTFLDIFRMGKYKSKLTTPTSVSGFDNTAPMLRTTSDSISAIRTQQLPSGQIHHIPVNLPGISPRGRVVVVREKMEDIMVAAKQAEQDIKTKSASRMDQGSQNDADAVEDAIDPTDAVDIPLPSPTYPFAVQASALHGLGVQESVGADVLADRLPPNMPHSYDPIEDRWRKALLTEAVHHSLDDMSSFSNILGASTPVGSFRKKSTETLLSVTTPTTQMLSQKIIDQPMIDMIESTPASTEKRSKSANSQRSKMESNSRLAVLAVNNLSQSSRPGSFLPQRVETPSGPMTSLGPAPRRMYANVVASLSQTELNVHDPHRSSQSHYDHEFRRSLRRTHSSPQLVEGYDSAASLRDTVIPLMPDLFRLSQATTVSTIRAGCPTVIHSPTEWWRRNLIRDSVLRRSSFETSRPSLSEYSQLSASPSTSAFPESINHSNRSESHHQANSSLFSMEQQNAMRECPSLRYSTMSPPPRMSSSLAHVALSPPPPRSSSSGYQSFLSHVPTFPLSDTSESSRNQLAESLEVATLQIVAPGPTTPPLPEEQKMRREERPFHHRRSRSSRTIPSIKAIAPITFQSTPGPTSPTSFFDNLQTQPNAMDDLDSSEEEDNGVPVIPTSPKPLSDPRARAASTATFTSPRPLIMRHGNFSTPYLRPGAAASCLHFSPVGNNAVSNKPIENVPLRPSKHEPPLSSYDFFKYAQEHPLALTSGKSRRSATTENLESSTKANSPAQESLKKLDRILMRHIEDEKDTIKRIAHNLKQTSQS